MGRFRTNRSGKSANSSPRRTNCPLASSRNCGRRFRPLRNSRMPRILRVAPEVPVLAVRKSAAYYADKLGFETVMVMAQGDYAIVERDGVAIHLFQAGAGTGPVSIHIFAHGLDDLHDELRRRGAAV